MRCLMVTLLFVLCAAFATAAVGDDQAVERQHVLTITAPDLEGGILSEITWDNGTLLLQGVVANPDGSLSGRYVVIPAQGTTLERRTDQTDASLAYWEKKAKRVSPTGLGTISTGIDAKIPMYGISSLEQRLGDAADMGGMRKKLTVRLGSLIIHEREDGREP